MVKLLPVLPSKLEEYAPLSSQRARDHREGAGKPEGSVPCNGAVGVTASHLGTAEQLSRPLEKGNLLLGTARQGGGKKKK